jgi:hypothetical protein
LRRDLAKQAGARSERLLVAIRPSGAVANVAINTNPCVRCAFYALFRPKWPTPAAADATAAFAAAASAAASGGGGTVKGGGSGDDIAANADDDDESGRYWGQLMRSRIAHAPPGTLGCLKIRTGYPENPLCFPDATPRSTSCMEATLAQPPCRVAYTQHMAARLRVRRCRLNRRNPS